MTKVIKRDGRKVEFDKSKIRSAILKAFIDVDEEETSYSKEKAREIANYVESLDKDMTVENIQDIIVNKLMASSRKDVATKYIEYRYKRRLIRESNTTDKSILELLDGDSDYWNTENSNKNAVLVTTQRDYLAGITSEDISKRYLLPKDVVEANNNGVIHFHDCDYFAQKALSNCSLINLEDMLQNGTVINGIAIDKPHRFITATTIATQIITAVASSQYGGTTISLTHLAPFVRDSYTRYLNKYLSWGFSDKDAKTYAEIDTKKEIADGVQTFNYQVNSMSTVNGQSPFITVFMYINENKEYSQETAMIIEEFLNQRILGMKNEKGVYITVAFPKLIYVLDEDNITEDSKYWWLTKLSAKCTAKRLVPDYISAKKMNEFKEGNVFPNMSCVEGMSVIRYKWNDIPYVESFKRMWKRLSQAFMQIPQLDNKNMYMNVENVYIFDNKNGYVKVEHLIRNISTKWYNISFEGGRLLTCTEDHPLPVINKGRTFAKDLKIGDRVPIIENVEVKPTIQKFDEDISWLDGVMLCDGNYSTSPCIRINRHGEDEIKENVINIMKKYYGSNVKVILHDDDKHKNCMDLRCVAQDSETLPRIRDRFFKLFGGNRKIDRHIPNEVFTYSTENRLSFLAGMIDADGYMNEKSQKIQMGSTNYELAQQQMLLAQSLGMKSYLYKNYYRGKQKHPDKIRLRVEFYPTKELMQYIKCKKKVDKFKINNIISSKEYKSGAITDIDYIEKEMFSYDVTTESDHFDCNGIYSHNCRSFLAPWTDENGNAKFYGRFNQGVVTLSLPDVAFSCERNFDTFWELMEQRSELVHKALLCRHERLEGTLSDVAPILWQDGAFARLGKHEKIDSLLHGGYSSISFGYAGLYECVKYMTGESHTHEKGEEFAISILNFMNEKCKIWTEQDDIGYSIYGTPIESTTYTFSKLLKKRFGDDIFIKLDGQDRNYITNSYHVPVFENINPFDKLSKEATFQKLSTGGCISYIETSDMNSNTDAVLNVMQFIYDHTMYAELNTKSDYCHVCGYDGEIKIIDENGTLKWECPNCKNKDQDRMNIARRVCGYISTTFPNQGRTDEIAHRFIHLDNHDVDEVTQ